MSDISDIEELPSTPPHISEKAENAVKIILPQKSKKVYEKLYQLSINCNFVGFCIEIRVIEFYILNMNDEQTRRNTFANFNCSNNPNIDKNVLAQTGFYATGDGEKIKCHFCKTTVYSIQADDNPVSLHLRTNSSCPLMRRQPTHNIPIDKSDLDKVLPPKIYDVCGTGYDIESKYPEYKSIGVRKSSFLHWPKTSKLDPDALAEAGFFYIREGDKVACFSCGLGLMDFEDDDDPYVEHARWHKNCEYLQLIKGKDFINEVQKRLSSSTTNND